MVPRCRPNGSPFYSLHFSIYGIYYGEFMKLYTFVNSYILGMQVGIQASHSNIEFMREHGAEESVREWAQAHKTFVWLDGGGSDKMIENIKLLKAEGFIVSYFREPGLANVVTSFSVLVDEDVLDEVAKYKDLYRKYPIDIPYEKLSGLTVDFKVLDLFTKSRTKKL